MAAHLVCERALRGVDAAGAKVDKARQGARGAQVQLAGRRVRDGAAVAVACLRGKRGRQVAASATVLSDSF